MRRRLLVTRLTVASFVWSLGLVLAALLVPVYNQTESGTNGLSLSRATLVQADGAKVLIPVALPAVLTLLIGLAIRRRYRRGRDWTATAAWFVVGLLVALAAVSILSLGAFVIPAVILLSFALKLLPEGRRDREGPPRRVWLRHRPSSVPSSGPNGVRR